MKTVIITALILASVSVLSLMASINHSLGKIIEIQANALAEYQADHGISPAVGYYGPVTRKYIASQ